MKMLKVISLNFFFFFLSNGFFFIIIKRSIWFSDFSLSLLCCPVLDFRFANVKLRIELESMVERSNR